MDYYKFLGTLAYSLRTFWSPFHSALCCSRKKEKKSSLWITFTIILAELKTTDAHGSNSVKLAGDFREINSSCPKEMGGGEPCNWFPKPDCSNPIFYCLSQSLYNLNYSHLDTCLPSFKHSPSPPQCLQEYLPHSRNLTSGLWMRGNIFLIIFRNINSVLTGQVRVLCPTGLPLIQSCSPELTGRWQWQ